MFLDWLLKTEEDNIGYDQLKMLAQDNQAGVSEDGNLLWAEYYSSSSTYYHASPVSIPMG